MSGSRMRSVSEGVEEQRMMLEEPGSYAMSRYMVRTSESKVIGL